MNKRLIGDMLGWGTVLWFFGYVLGFLFFAFVPVALIGWFITPIATAVTVFVLWKYVKSDSLTYALTVGAVWTVLAIVLDYLFIVMLLNLEDGYYKFDVYLYYALTLLLPPLVYSLKQRSAAPNETAA